MESSNLKIDYPEGKLSEFEELMKEYKLDEASDTFFDRLGTVSVALIGLLAAFAWDHVAKELFMTFFPKTSSLGMHVLYAITLTLLVVVVSLNLPSVRHYMKFKKAIKEMGKKKEEGGSK